MRCLGVLLFAFSWVGISTGWSAEKPRPNVLLIVSDDLNNFLGCYGDKVVKTPCLDQLAARGMLFDRAYCAFPLCGPSRNAFLTGLYPNSTGIVENGQVFRQTIPSQRSMPQTFRNHGYFAVRIGKLYHYNVPNSVGTNGHDDPGSWEMELNPAGIDRLEELEKTYTLTPGQFGGTLSWHASPKADIEHTDGQMAENAEWVLEHCAKRKDRPFFLSVGFFRPHTPYISPQRYFDLYPLDKMRVVQGVNEDQADLPAAALGSFKKEESRLTDDLRRQALQAYCASISFMDAQVGRVIAALDRNGLADNTIVVFTSDHGYHTGEHGLWQKRSLFEESARVPLLVVAPGVTGKGTIAKSPVSQIDLFPTLAELCGVTPPPNLQGQSLVTMLKDPAATGRGFAVTQVLRGNANQLPGSATANPQSKNVPFFGYSIRTSRWRYTEWDEGRQGTELYDHDLDPHELTNLAQDNRQGTILAELSKQLRTAVASSFPPNGERPKLRTDTWGPNLTDP